MDDYGDLNYWPVEQDFGPDAVCDCCQANPAVPGSDYCETCLRDGGMA